MQYNRFHSLSIRSIFVLHVPVVRCAMDSVVSDQAHDDTSPSTDEPNYENYNTKN